ncbi:hypothetical protein BN2127_JRS10_03704 [Bacillus subtilis]|nr:hypothetical protein BN2127_JRS10_03704 [Bacillus subtilis]
MGFVEIVVLEFVVLHMDFVDIEVPDFAVLHMDFEDIHNLDVCRMSLVEIVVLEFAALYMDFVDNQLLDIALLRMDFVHIVALAVVTLVLHIVLYIFVLVPAPEGKMVVVGKAVDYYRTYLFLLHDDAYHLVYGRTRKYVMKKCGRVTISNWVKIK